MKRLLPPTWRRLNRLSTAMLLLTLVATISAYAIHSATVQADTHIPHVRRGIIPAANIHPRLQYLHMVDFSKLPIISGQRSGRGAQSAPILPTLLGLPNTRQRAAYARSLNHLPGLPQVAGQSLDGLKTPPPPNFDSNGYQDLPWQEYAHDGLGPGHPADTLGPANTSIAANPLYTLAAGQQELEVYDFAGHVIAGPISIFDFFGGGIGPGPCTVFGGLSVLWDATRNHWIIELDEVNACIDGTPAYGGHFYIASSTGQSPTLNPATQWKIYDVYGGDSDCGLAQQPQVGSDYWGLWLTYFTCNSNGIVTGNAVMEVNKNQLYSNAGGAGTEVFSNIPSGISCGSGCLQPASNFVPALEDGTPDAEFLVATDAGYGGPFADLITVAFTNTRAITQNQAPTASYVITQLPLPYADPVAVSSGVAQVQYTGGDLFTAWTTAVRFNGDPTVHDGVYWLDERPQLTPLDPSNPGAQVATLPLVRNSGIYGFTSYNAYNPSLTATSELDLVLVMALSTPAMNASSLIYTARRATDAPNVLGFDGYAVSVQGTQPPSNSNTSCSLDTNLTTRGLVWCIGGNYMPPNNTGPDSYVVGLATE